MNDIEIFATTFEDAFEQLSIIGLDTILNKDCVIVHMPDKTFVYAFEDGGVEEKPLPTPPLVSVGIITKNDAKYITQCLLSVKHIADEIIVIDLGSTDDTIQIAEEFGAKVFKYEWQYNLSLHQNQAMQHATGKWVFILHVVEKIKYRTDFNTIKTFIQTLPEEFGIIVIRSEPIPIWYVSSLFKRGKIEFRGIQYPQPMIIKDEVKTIYCPDMYLIGVDELGKEKAVKTIYCPDMYLIGIDEPSEENPVIKGV